MRGKYSLALAALLLLTCPMPRAAAATPMATGGPVVPPRGFIHFCAKHLQECVGTSQDYMLVPLSAERRRQLESVQSGVNHAVRPRENPVHAWDYPLDGYGDCNNYALEKRRELVALGWPRAALLLAAAVTETGEGHLVLVARTSEGDLVLDNRLAAIVDWGRLPYRWVSRQSEVSATLWVSITAQPTVAAEAPPVD